MVPDDRSTGQTSAACTKPTRTNTNTYAAHALDRERVLYPERQFGSAYAALRKQRASGLPLSTSNDQKSQPVTFWQMSWHSYGWMSSGTLPRRPLNQPDESESVRLSQMPTIVA